MDREALERIGRVENDEGDASVGSLFYVPCNLDATNDPEDLEAMARVYHLLTLYACSKRDALERRGKGLVQEAQKSERDAERYYQDLPSWARW